MPGPGVFGGLDAEAAGIPKTDPSSSDVHHIIPLSITYPYPPLLERGKKQCLPEKLC
jgi:hypothetical protein